MNDFRFDPFATSLDEVATLRLVKEALIGCDDGELYLERRSSETLGLEDGRIKNASYKAAQGFGLRGITGATSAYAHGNTLSERALKEAGETIRHISNAGGGKMSIAPSKGDQSLYAEIDPVASVNFAAKVEVLKEIDAYARSLSAEVVQVSANLSAERQDVVILRDTGARFDDMRPLVRANISVTLERDGRRETGSAGGGGRFDMTHITEPTFWKAKVDEALRIARVNLGALAAPAGVMDVVLGPGWPGILLHEAIGHGLEGDFNRKGSSAFAGLMGQAIASKGVTVFDDGTLANRRGSIQIDDEGTAAQKTTLIDDGVLVGYMQDRQNGRLMGTGSTGNGRRQSFEYAPMPRMTNTYMLGGEAAPEDLVNELEDGLYAVGFGGGQVDITNGKFVFSCTEAYRVRKGKIEGAVKGATLIGDGATALKTIRGIGNDMALDPGMGTCGKSGQWVPVGVGQPSLLIGGLTIGGSDFS